MKKYLRWYFIAPAAIFVGIPLLVAFGALAGQIVKLLWNWLMPPLFGWREITVWQGLGLLTLCRILFGGHGGGSHYKPPTSTGGRRVRQGIRERFSGDSSANQAQAPAGDMQAQ